MMILKFSYNWNGKLHCKKAFTTIRIYNKDKHFVGQRVEIVYKDFPVEYGRVEAVRKFMLADLNPFMSYIDTGYDVAETTAIIKQMYPETDFTRTPLAFLLIIKDNNNG